MTLAIALMVVAQMVSPAPPLSQRRRLGRDTDISVAGNAAVVIHLRLDRGGVLRGTFDSLDQRIWNAVFDDSRIIGVSLSGWFR